MPHLVSGSSQSTLKHLNNSAQVVQQRSIQMMDAEVQAILTDGFCCLIVSDDNDFTENVSRITDGKCEYIRIQTRCWQSMSPLDLNIWGR